MKRPRVRRVSHTHTREAHSPSFTRGSHESAPAPQQGARGHPALVHCATPLVPCVLVDRSSLRRTVHGLYVHDRVHGP
eukprot:7151238-Prymnesium_polylepis.1